MTSPKQLTFHLLPNAHLDPVWLWDWQEGLNEGLITVRTVLDLMDEVPELTFMRGESAIYEHIQKTDPATFRRILKRVEEGRWEVVGGTVIQPDTNLASTEVLCRQFERGLDYFKKNLGVRPTAAWLADSFGHTAGLPNILSAFGMEGFSFTRPQRNQFPLESPAFWWEGEGGNRILCYRQHWKAYCSERDNLCEMLDVTLAGAQKLEFINAGVQFGLGNHGGGPTRKHLRDVEEWKQAHPEVGVKFGTLHGLFAELKKEGEAKPALLSTVRGEFGFCLRGCYSSVQKFKSLYRHGESQVADAEITRSVIGVATEAKPGNLSEAWDALLFNAFHDILPGTSIERAYEEQAAWMGLAMHRARTAKFEALNRLAARIDTSVPPPRRPDLPADVPVVIWNPLPRPFIGLAEMEASLDYRPLWKYRDRASELPVAVHDHEGKPAAFQIVDTEHGAMTSVPWRKRVVVPVEIPALGWTTVRLGWRDEHPAAHPDPACSARRDETPQITNGYWSVEAKAGTVCIQRKGANIFSTQRNLEIRMLEDPWGSWGGEYEKTESSAFNHVRENWSLQRAEVLEAGPLRAKMWTRWQGTHSWLELTFVLAAGLPRLTIEGRLLWNERSARLKLILPCPGALEYDVPGTRIARDAQGHVPGGRWVVRSEADKKLGFASDVLSDFDAAPDELRVTLARASRYANDVQTSPSEKPWQPAVDCGELKFQCALFGEDSEPDHVADALLFPPSTLHAPATAGPWGRQGSLGNLSPDTMRLLSIEQVSATKLKLRVQNRSQTPSSAVFHFGESRFRLGKLKPGQIKTCLLRKKRKRS